MSADPPGLAAAPDETITESVSSDGNGAAGRPVSPSTSRYAPAPGSRRSRLSKAIADRFTPTPMPDAPPTGDAPAVTANVPSRQVSLPPVPPTRPLTDSEQAAANQVARAAAARAATMAPVIEAPTAESLAPPKVEAPVVPQAPPLAPPVPIPVPVPSPEPEAVPRPAREPRPAKALPPGETGMVVEDEPTGRRLSRREQKQLGRLRARKVRRIVRHIEPWSVFKISLLFYFCLFVTFMVAGTLLWNLAASAGTIDNILNFLNDLGGGELTVDGEIIFRASLYGGLVLVIASSLFNVLLAVLFNLISDLVGGIRVTVIEEERVRRGPSARTAR